MRAGVCPLLVGTLTLLAATSSPAAQASDGRSAGTTYEACGLVAGQYLTTIQLLQQGFDAAVLKETLPGLTGKGARRIRAIEDQISEDGLIDTYSSVNARYARCASRVNDNQGKPEPKTREQHFYICAGENKVQYEIMLAALAGGHLEEVKPQLAKAHRGMAEKIYRRLGETNVATVFREMASELKACLNTAPQR